LCLLTLLKVALNTIIIATLVFNVWHRFTCKLVCRFIDTFQVTNKSTNVIDICSLKKKNQYIHTYIHCIYCIDSCKFNYHMITNTTAPDFSYKFVHLFININKILFVIILLYIKKIFFHDLFIKKNVHIVVYSIHHYVIKFVVDLRQVSVFFHVLRFPLQIKLTATI
jgi:hypothetical protein